MIVRLNINRQPRLFSNEELQEIIDGIVFEFPCGVNPVTYSETAPADTTLPWQPTDGCCRPVGQVRHFSNGQWIV